MPHRTSIYVIILCTFLTVLPVALIGCGALITAATMSGKLPDAATVLEAAVRAGRAFTDPGSELRTIGRNESASGMLNEEDYQLDDGTYFDTWFYSGTQGERIQIDLWSEDFDPFLVLGFMEGGLEGSFVQLDAAGGIDESQPVSIEIVLEHSGTYAILANTVEVDQTGAYRLRVLGLESKGEASSSD